VGSNHAGPGAPDSATAAAYEELRPLLFSIAYRMLGSVTEAEDIVQEAFLRYHRTVASQGEPGSPKAYLSAVVTRLCIDQLRSASLLLLERLTPLERAALLLHDVFSLWILRDCPHRRPQSGRLPSARPPGQAAHRGRAAAVRRGGQ
jgi:hypothetical protein